MRNSQKTKEQRELFENKERVFKEIPSLMLAVELFGTFEVIEDYLLNKLTGKEDLNLRPSHRHNYFNYESFRNKNKRISLINSFISQNSPNTRNQILRKSPGS